jgi:hypothetical protein
MFMKNFKNSMYKLAFVCVAAVCVTLGGGNPASAIEYDQENPDSVVRAFAMALIEGDEAVVRQLLDPRNPFTLMELTELYDLMSDVQEKDMSIQKNAQEHNNYHIRNNVKGVSSERLGTYELAGMSGTWEAYINVDLARIGKKYIIKNASRQSTWNSEPIKLKLGGSVNNLKKSDLDAINPLNKR